MVYNYLKIIILCFYLMRITEINYWFYIILNIMLEFDERNKNNKYNMFFLK